MKKLICCLLVCLLLPALALAAPQPLTMQGLSKVVADHKGQVVVVNFFATWCPPCREELPHLVKLAKEYQGKVVFVGLSVDEDASVVPPFLKKMGITYPVYLPQEDLIRSFGVRTIPHNVVYGPDGVMQANQPGYVDGESLKAFIDSLLEHK